MPDVVDFHDYKRVATRVRRAIDFAGEMESGDTVSTGAVTAKDALDVDVSSSLIELVSASGTKLLWTFKAWGTAGASYYVRAVATTAGGDVLPRVLELQVHGL